ncbi:MAG: flavin reductase family protein [Candidatus Undinarchaeales archaeon]|jgi:flavin reductase (DIM6/NTAB) family NADH-FMN oxidoreductase RutF|nr:flavin reductase family protein [Candidatus Undinarchaeales archaeon]MDP7491871.1 flavin reductase family protein [Candidatus Undinarchaeales archaeon]
MPSIATFRTLLPAPPVVLVTARDRQNDRHDTMPAAWMMPVSVRPPLLAVSIAPGRYTHSLVEREGAFILNVPGKDLLAKVHAAGCTSGRSGDKLAGLGLTGRTGDEVDTLILDCCPAAVECRVTASHPAGDHTIFVAEVVAVHAEPGLDRLTLLQHLGGSSYCTGGERLEA